MKFGQRILMMMLASVMSCTWAEEPTDSKRRDMAFRHVMYEVFQSNHRNAYITAGYYQMRQIGSDSMLLAQAAASLELGFLEHGRELIDGLDESSLLPENQSRLRLYLARDAYRRRDWPLLEQHLSWLADDAAKESLYASYTTFLNIELARHQQAFSRAGSLIGQLDPEFELYGIARFNLAASYAANGESQSAINELEDLLAKPALNLADSVLADRVRISLAELYIKRGDQSEAVDVLVKVSANHHYGPFALSMLARIYTAEERFENAAAIWQHLSQVHPFHSASTYAVSGLGYSLQMARGDNSAYAAYSSGLEQLLGQQQRLGQVALNLSEDLQNPDDLSESNMQLGLRLSEILGHEGWLSWFASDEVRILTNRWQALDQAYRGVVSGQENLNALLEVDGEQQARIAAANSTVQSRDLDTELNYLVLRLEQNRRDLSTRRIQYDEDLDRFASQDQNELLSYIEDLKLRVSSVKGTGDHSELIRRMQRLEGVVRFGVFDQVPTMKQKRIHAIDQQLLLALEASERLARIVKAADYHPESVSTRIENLATRLSLLEGETELALRDARTEVIAGLQRVIEHDQARLGQQIAGLRYDLTRLADRRVAGGVR